MPPFSLLFFFKQQNNKHKNAIKKALKADTHRSDEIMTATSSDNNIQNSYTASMRD